MSATPQDFYTWSQLTGNPVPRTAQERMILAPHVRSFVQNIGRQGGYVPEQQSGLRRAVDVIGKTALAAGGLTLAALAGKHYAERGLREAPDVEVRGEGVSSPSGTGFTPGMGGLTPEGSGGPTPTPTAPRGGPSGGKTYDDPWRGSYATPSVDVGRPTGVTVTALPQLPPSNEPAEVRMASAARSVSAGPGPESLVGETNIQLGTPFETPVQRAQGQEDLRMYGQPKAGAVEAFRAGPKYAAMREAYPALREEYPTEPSDLPQVVRESRDVTPPTPAQLLNQGAVAPDVQALQAARGAAPGTVARETIVSQPAPQAERITSSQAFGLENQAPTATTGATAGTFPTAPQLSIRHLAALAESGADRTGAINALYRNKIDEARSQLQGMEQQEAAAKARRVGPTAEEARDLMNTLNASHSHLNRIQRELLRDQLLEEKYNPKVEEVITTSEEPGRVSAQDFLSEKIGKPRMSGVQSVEAQRSQMPSMIVPGRENEPGRIQFHREHGVIPPARAGSSFAFGPQDELSRHLANVQNLGYDPNEIEKPMWW